MVFVGVMLTYVLGWTFLFKKRKQIQTTIFRWANHISPFGRLLTKDQVKMALGREWFLYLRSRNNAIMLGLM